MEEVGSNRLAITAEGQVFNGVSGAISAADSAYPLFLKAPVGGPTIEQRVQEDHCTAVRGGR